ncbi:uncharacterized protein [Antedon mediterranea]|uniref:uncharacterized protein n=1 Tax=Antedon mediterranea TaxID=105859 RepID=UPI003AF8BEB1
MACIPWFTRQNIKNKIVEIKAEKMNKCVNDRKKLIVGVALFLSLYFIIIRYGSKHSFEEIHKPAVFFIKEEKYTFKECHTELRYDPSLPLRQEGCQRAKPDVESCLLADELFFSSPVATCEHQQINNICEIIEAFEFQAKIKCSDTTNARKHVLLGEINNKTGKIEWQDFASTRHLESHLNRLFDKKVDNYGFYFIKFATDANSTDGKDFENNMGIQLLVVPPILSKTKTSHDNISINILLLDSVSHSHFLRSMPTSLESLRQINKKHVFNFELFQSLKGKTYNNLEALFSGELYQKEEPFEMYNSPPTPINIKRLLDGFKDQDFETMYTEDLCWQGEWGLIRNMLAYDPGDDIKLRWEKFRKSIDKAGIDRIDMTLASCEILNENGVRDPFLGSPSICYNGKYQHQYILDYLTKRQTILERNDQPFFHFTLLNVAHDEHGHRIQTLDRDFATYIKTVSELNNTLTIIMSDHGNTYGEYVKRAEEARVEMFHSVLFMLVPPGVAETLGPKRSNSLRINQQRLVSILDLHYALRFLSETKLGNLDEKHKQYSIKPDGIFSEIPSNRSCSDIPRIEPNVCICQDFEKVASKDARYALLAEFALGTINNVIQEQYRKSNPDTKRGFGSCQRLVAHHFGNIKQRYNANGDHEVKMNLYIANPDDSVTMELFMVVLKVVKREGPAGMKFVAYNRVKCVGDSYRQFVKVP